MRNIKTRPAGVTALATTIILLAVGKVGLKLTADQAASIVGALTALASTFFPRQYTELEDAVDGFYTDSTTH